MVDVSNTVNRFTLDALRNQIFVRELIESTIGCRLTWSRNTANSYIVRYNEGSEQWEHHLTRINSNVESSYALDSFRDGHAEFNYTSQQISEIVDLWNVVGSNFMYIAEISGVTRCAEGRRSVDLRDTDGEYLSITHANQKNLNTDESFTITVWVYINDKSKQRNIVQKGGNYRIYYDNGTDRFVFAVTTVGGTEVISAGTLGSPSTGQWYFLQCWYDKDLQEIRINVDRADLNEDADSNDGLLNLEPGEDDFYVGETWEGRIDKVAFYSKVIDDALADRIYNNGVGVAYTRMPRNALVSYWEMNEEFGTRYDSTGRLNHLVENTNDTEFFGEGILSTDGAGT